MKPAVSLGYKLQVISHQQFLHVQVLFSLRYSQASLGSKTQAIFH